MLCVHVCKYSKYIVGSRPQCCWSPLIWFGFLFLDLKHYSVNNSGRLMPFSRSSLVTEVKVRHLIWPQSSLDTVGTQVSPSRQPSCPQLCSSGSLEAFQQEEAPCKPGCTRHLQDAAGFPDFDRFARSEQTCFHTCRIHLNAPCCLVEHGLTDSLSLSWMGPFEWKRTIHPTQISSFMHVYCMKMLWTCGSRCQYLHSRWEPICSLRSKPNQFTPASLDYWDLSWEEHFQIFFRFLLRSALGKCIFPQNRDSWEEDHGG